MKLRHSFLKFGYIILIIQNLLIFGYLFLRDPFTYYYYFIVFHLDLIGFGMITIGYICYIKSDTKVKFAYSVAGFFFASWILLRVVNQFIIPLVYDFSSLRSQYDSSLSFFIIPYVYGLVKVGFWGGSTTPLPPLSMVLIYVLNAFLLLIAFVFCELYPYVISKENRNISQIFSLTYPSFNLIAVLNHSLPFLNTILLDAYFNDGISSTGLFLKISLVPLLGIIVFFLIIKRIKE